MWDKFYLNGHMPPCVLQVHLLYCLSKILDTFRAQFQLDSIFASVFIYVCTHAKHQLNTAIHRYQDNVPHGDDDRAARWPYWHIDLALRKIKIFYCVRNICQHGQNAGSRRNDLARGPLSPSQITLK